MLDYVNHEMDYIPLSDMVPGGVYRAAFRACHGVGVWDAGRCQLHAMRRKFGETFLFGEYHWDCDSPMAGTARPTELLEVIPDAPAMPGIITGDATEEERDARYREWRESMQRLERIVSDLNEKYEAT